MMPSTLPFRRTMRLLSIVIIPFFGLLSELRLHAEPPADKFVSLLQGELGEWKIKPASTARIEIAPMFARPLWQGEDDALIAAIGHRKTGGRAVVFSDSAFFDPKNSATGEAARKGILNCIRWAGAESSPKVGLGFSLEDFARVIEGEGLQTRLIKASQLADQVDVYCLAGQSENEFSEEDRQALGRFVSAGGGLVLAGAANELQVAALNSLISPAGIRFTAPGEANPGPMLTVIASPANSENATNAKVAAKTTESPSRPSAMIIEREEITLPQSADGPVGAALQLMNEAGKRDDASLIAELRNGTKLTGEDLAVFQEALYQLNLKVGPIIPTSEEPVVPKADPLVDAIMEIETEFNDTLPAEQIRKIPAADDYPGAVPEDAPRIAKTVTIDVNYKGWLPRNNGGGARADERRPTGLYAPPGEPIRVTVPANLTDKGLSVRIGAYRGVLSDEWEQLKRYPKLARNFPIEGKSTLAANGLGGIITILVPRGMKGDESDWREIEIEGAVETPLYVHEKTSPEEWIEIRKRPGPWAELASDRMILTLPSEDIRDLRNPDEVMDLWDKIVESTAELAMLDRNKYRAERIVFDRQLSNPGVALHAGQPIAAHTGQAVERATTPELMRSPRVWGFLHELGHVHQDKAWSLPGSVEASCNLWSVYVAEKLLGVPRSEAHRTTDPLARRTTMNAYFNSGANFDSDWERETALESYLQIEEAFGWIVFQKLFQSYQDYDDPRQFSDQQEINDEFVVRLSKICGVDLAPFYKTWGLQISEDAATKAADLPEWEEDPVKRFRE